MARKLRIQYPGAIYHIMSRGDRREAIFKDDADRERFLATMAETCAKTGLAGARLLPDGQLISSGGGNVADLSS